MFRSIIRSTVIEHNGIAAEMTQSVCDMAVHQDKVDRRISVVEHKLSKIDTTLGDMGESLLEIRKALQLPAPR